jgi:hypothetical protein
MTKYKLKIAMLNKTTISILHQRILGNQKYPITYMTMALIRQLRLHSKNLKSKIIDRKGKECFPFFIFLADVFLQKYT